MATAAEDISRSCLAFAISAAIIAVLLCAAAATWMGALLLGFHTLQSAFRLPKPFGPYLVVRGVVNGPASARVLAQVQRSCVLQLEQARTMNLTTLNPAMLTAIFL